MNKTLQPDRSLALSVACYRLLLLFYPPSFRREFADDMTQVFRDSLRQARQQGSGQEIARLWTETLLDLFLTALEEHASAVLRLSRAAVIQYSGTACVLGGLLWILAFSVWLGGPGIWEDTGPVGVFAYAPALVSPAALMFLFAFIGLHHRQVGGTGRLARTGFTVGVLGAVFCLTVNIYAGWLREANWWWSWWYAASGSALLCIGLLIFGLAVLRARALAGWRNSLPLLLGFTGLSLLLFGNIGLSPLFTVIWLCFGLGWILLGFAVDGQPQTVRRDEEKGP